MLGLKSLILLASAASALAAAVPSKVIPPASFVEESFFNQDSDYHLLPILPHGHRTIPAAPPAPTATHHGLTTCAASLASLASVSPSSCSELNQLFSLPRSNLGLPPLPSDVDPNSVDSQMATHCRTTLRTCGAALSTAAGSCRQVTSDTWPSSSSSIGRTELLYQAGLSSTLCAAAERGCMHRFITLAASFPFDLTAEQRVEWCAGGCIQDTMKMYASAIAPYVFVGGKEEGVAREAIERANMRVCEGYRKSDGGVPATLKKKVEGMGTARPRKWSF
ncbi:hypothetical protein HK101_000581 [Irineochytrium annulatum]|nr:hypothetical protein HK101_000581 [Irineochytrium annulatum]